MPAALADAMTGVQLRCAAADPARCSATARRARSTAATPIGNIVSARGRPGSTGAGARRAAWGRRWLADSP
jgi:hypothetical protein